MRPYYTDPYTSEFDSKITRSFLHEGRHAVVLESSYFYPTSGGQEHDTGTINGVGVVDVVESDGEVIHIVASEIPTGQAHCVIDRDRRFENMQQHTGQHILSAAFDNLFDIATVSSRLGERIGTIDLDRQPTVDELRQAVAASNSVIRENREVIIHFADQKDIDSFKLRKPPKVEGTVRIVEVKDFDFSPCGGTHCTHASEIGVILTGNVEKIKGSLTRIEFFCGERAVRRYSELFRWTLESSRLLSSQPDTLAEAVQKMKEQSQEKDSKIKQLSERVLKSSCEELKSRVAGFKGRFESVDVGDAAVSTDEVRFLASCVSREIAAPFAFYRFEGNICQMNVHLPVEDGTATSLINTLRDNFKAKGGGRGGFYALSFDRASLDGIVQEIRRRLSDG